ncbi:MAG TPA: hypothetical protein VE134_01210 [Methanomicrobiales archaeon]|nr:hypothetical protein [Methanomicrobiales archaeon]
MLEDHILAHLETIERAYQITILNKDDIARWIGMEIVDENQLLPITTAMNTWIAVQDVHGMIAISRQIVDMFLRNAAKR